MDHPESDRAEGHRDADADEHRDQLPDPEVPGGVAPDHLHNRHDAGLACLLGVLQRDGTTTVIRLVGLVVELRHNVQHAVAPQRVEQPAEDDAAADGEPQVPDPAAGVGHHPVEHRHQVYRTAERQGTDEEGLSRLVPMRDRGDMLRARGGEGDGHGDYSHEHHALEDGERGYDGGDELFPQGNEESQHDHEGRNEPNVWHTEQLTVGLGPGQRI